MHSRREIDSLVIAHEQERKSRRKGVSTVHRDHQQSGAGRGRGKGEGEEKKARSEKKERKKDCWAADRKNW